MTSIYIVEAVMYPIVALREIYNSYGGKPHEKPFMVHVNKYHFMKVTREFAKSLNIDVDYYGIPV